ncbi:DUF2235 domain-containing protein [Aliiroseovarius sp. YM-037]|uniref:DUF2235 domain-containing protein n=1 Tax=Aliiroseovarius sp. YM-037 TaxID=3341728 RepID=UPI003A80D28B
MRFLKRIGAWLGLSPGASQSPPQPRRGRVDHVVLLDGTMSSLTPGCETNVGLTYKLLSEVAPAQHLSLRYEAGIQWRQWRNTLDVIQGAGINRQIRRAYGFIASRYRPGDRIFLFGYSRGAYAVRSLAGVIDRVGLLRADQATERNITTAYRHYRCAPDTEAAAEFRKLYCHPNVEIEMVGIWDSVKALGFRAPLIWKFFERSHAFHNHQLGQSIRHGYHALAIDETRVAYEPVLWNCPPDWDGEVQQMWFRGCHGDIGGQLGGHEASRPLANIPLVWILEKAEGCDLTLPEDWRARFPMDVNAPSVGTTKGWGKLFLARRKRMIGQDRSEAIHESAHGHRTGARLARSNLFPWQELPEGY